MGLNLSNLGPVYIVCGKTYLRKEIDSLAYLIQSQLDLDPFSKSVFLFCGGKSDRFKAIYWDGEGFWLLYNRFENGQLAWPRSTTEIQALTPKQADKQSLGHKGLDYCDQLFSLEASWAELPSDERLCKRKERLAPLMMAFFDWCRNQSVLPESKLGSAISHAVKYEETFKTVLAEGSLVLSNNLAERVIKGLVMRRKNWLFSQSFEGPSLVQSSCHF